MSHISVKNLDSGDYESDVQCDICGEIYEDPATSCRDYIATLSNNKKAIIQFSADGNWSPVIYKAIDERGAECELTEKEDSLVFDFIASNKEIQDYIEHLDGREEHECKPDEAE